MLKKISKTIEFIKNHPDIKKRIWFKNHFGNIEPSPEEFIYEIFKSLN